MKVFNSVASWLDFRKTLPTQSIGFAPTMGNLHEGHRSLFLRSAQENDCSASTLFVNPTQFNQKEDYTNYPRTLDEDLELMSKAGIDFCILPKEEELYADGYNYQISEQKYSTLMEGAHRPGHFNGVLTVVMKLMSLVQPTRAYFGEKDYQQYELIKGMVEAFFLSVEVIPCPTVRESSGLAYSSRNNRLTSKQKKIAEEFALIFHQSKPCDMIIRELEAKGITVDYIEDYQSRRYAAVVIGGIRLIDNYALL
jgi:pantoate--beta-alanine ligase